jgi:sigma-B regulation protein RsbU (phosphoserine phosphatase)
LEIEQLWGQFKSEARAGYALYSKEVDWERIHRERKTWKRPFLTAWALFHALLMKLSPARRVLLLLAVVLLIFQPDIHWGQGEFSFNLSGIGALILFLLLALELGDRVTMKRDLEIAREIQQWLVPEFPPQVPGFDIAFTTRPQNTVAGDYYDAFVRPLASGGSERHSLVVVVADVAGKSVPAALLMATFQASLRSLTATASSLDEIVSGLDGYAQAHSLKGQRFTTAFLAEIDPETREMQYFNAGHNHPLLRRASGQMERLSTGGPPFGVPPLTEKELPRTFARTRLEAGDLLLIFSDGLVETTNEAGEEFGEGRLIQQFINPSPQSAAEILRNLMSTVSQYAGLARQNDDITALLLRVTA